MNYWTPTRSVAVTVIVCHVVVVCLCLVIGWAFPSSDRHAAASETTRGAIAALATLWVCWLVLGGGASRGPGAIAIYFAYVAMLSSEGMVEGAFRAFDGSPNPAPRPAVFTFGSIWFVFFVGGLAPLAAIARVGRWRWRMSDIDFGSPSFRYSLRETLLTTLGLATVMAAWSEWRERLGEELWRAPRPPQDFTDVTATFVGLVVAGGLCFSYHAAAVWAGASLRPRLWIVATVVVAAFAAGLAMRALLPFEGLPKPEPYAIGTATSAALTMAYLLAFRAVGWRLERISPDEVERERAGAQAHARGDRWIDRFAAFREPPSRRS